MELAELKSQIQSQAHQGRAIRARIQGAQGLERYTLWNEKRDIGRRVRLLLLAYGHFRGRRYRSIESHTRDGNAPAPDALYDVLIEIGMPSELGDLIHWLEEPEVPPVQPSGPEVCA